MDDFEDWDFGELVKNIPPKWHDSVNDYLRSLSWQKARAMYHANHATYAAKQEYGPSVVIRIYGKDWKEPHVSVVADTLGCIHALHEMADAIAQLLNILILEDQLPEYRVTFHRILEKLKNRPRTPLFKAVLALSESNEFKYIDAFCNNVKHRFLIEHGRSVEVHVPVLEIPAPPIPKEGFSIQGTKFESFKRDNHRFPELWAEDIYKGYRNRIISLVENIICEMIILSTET